MNLWQIAFLPWVLALISIALSLAGFFTDQKWFYILSFVVIFVIWLYVRWLRKVDA